MELKDIQRLADLMHLTFTEKELKKFQGEFEKMLAFVGQISDADIGNTVEAPMVRALTELRSDEVRPSSSNEQVLANAPKKRDGFFVVPQVVE